MSTHLASLVLSRQFGSVTRKSIAHVLADHADSDTCSTFVGQERIAAEAEVSVRTVGRVLADFEAEGLIRRMHRARQGDGARGGRTSDRIWLAVDNIEKLPDSVSGNYPTQTDNGATQTDNGATQTDNGDDPNRQAMSGEPSENHQIEPSVRTAGETEIRDDTKSDLSTGLTVWVDPTTGKQVRREDRLWDTAVELWGTPATDAERGRRNREISELRKARVTPEELPTLFAIAVTRWEKKPGIAGLIRNLGDLRSGLEVGPGFVDELEARQRRKRSYEIAERLEAERRGLPG